MYEGEVVKLNTFPTSMPDVHKWSLSYSSLFTPRKKSLTCLLERKLGVLYIKKSLLLPRI
jgi:hypothetical protein